MTDCLPEPDCQDDILGVDADAESRAHSFRGALSTLDFVQVSPAEFWSVFGAPGRAKDETVAWLTSAIAKLEDLAKGMIR